MANCDPSPVNPHGVVATAAATHNSRISSARTPFSIRLRSWRNRVIASPKFRNWIARIPGLRSLANKKANTLFRITAGFVFSQVLGTCVKFGVFSELKDRAKTTEDLATAAGLPLERMQLLLEQAERLDLLVQIAPQCWMLDDAGVVVASDPGIVAMIRHHDMFYQDLETADTLLRSAGEDTQLKRFWAYAHGEMPAGIDTDTAKAYSTLMHDSQSMFSDCVLAAHDVGQYRALLDVGGGDGSFLAACAEKSPQLKLHLFDLPAVADLAKQHFQASGLKD